MRSAAMFVVILVAQPASAQVIQSMQLPEAQTDVISQERPRQRHVLVAGAVLADIDELDYISGGGPAPAVGIGIGVKLSSRYDLRGEFEMPGWHRHDNSAQGPPVTFEDHTATRTPLLAILLARHFGQRQDITLMLGFSLLAHEFRSSGFWERLNADGAVVEHQASDQRDMDYRAGLSLGVDIPFSLSQRLAFVPQLRLHRLINGHFGEILPSGYIAIRAGVALRMDL